MVEVMKIMATSSKRPHAGTAILSAPNPAADPCRQTPPAEAPGHSQQVWVSLLWGHCSFLLRPGSHKLLVVPSKSLFPQSCVSPGGSTVWQRRPPSRALMPYTGLRTQSPWPCGSPLLTHTSPGDAQTQFRLCLYASLGPGAHKVCLGPLSISVGYEV